MLTDPLLETRLGPTDIIHIQEWIEPRYLYYIDFKNHKKKMGLPLKLICMGWNYPMITRDIQYKLMSDAYKERIHMKKITPYMQRYTGPRTDDNRVLKRGRCMGCTMYCKRVYNKCAFGFLYYPT